MEESELKQRLQNQIGASKLTLEKAKASGTVINEAQTEHYLIDPLLAALGYELWEILKQGHDAVSQGIPDYTLLQGTSHKWFLEAKRLDHQLQDKDALQAFTYPFSQGTEWGVLTNGRTWHIYNAHLPKPLSEKRVIQIDDLFCDADAVEKLALLSRQSMANGGLTQAWTFSRVLAIVRDQLETPKSTIRKQLCKIIGDEIGIAVNEVTVGKAIASLATTTPVIAPKTISPAPTLSTKSGEVSISPSAVSAVNPASFHTFAEIAKDITLATFKKPQVLSFSDGHQKNIQTWAGAAQIVVEYVGQTYSLPQLPFSTSQKGKKCFLNASSIHGNGKTMSGHRIAKVGSNEIYIDTNRSASDIATSLSVFLAAVSAPPDIVKISIG